MTIKRFKVKVPVDLVIEVEERTLDRAEDKAEEVATWFIRNSSDYKITEPRWGALTIGIAEDAEAWPELIEGEPVSGAALADRLGAVPEVYATCLIPADHPSQTTAKLGGSLRGEEWGV